MFEKILQECGFEFALVYVLFAGIGVLIAQTVVTNSSNIDDNVLSQLEDVSSLAEFFEGGSSEEENNEQDPNPNDSNRNHYSNFIINLIGIIRSFLVSSLSYFRLRFGDILAIYMFPDDSVRLRLIHSDNEWLFEMIRLSFWKTASRPINAFDNLLNNFFLGCGFIGAWRVYQNRRNFIYSHANFTNHIAFRIYNRFWQNGFNFFSQRSNFDFYFLDRAFYFISTLRRFLRR